MYLGFLANLSLIISPGALVLYFMKNSEQLLSCILNVVMLLYVFVLSHFSYISLKLKNPRLFDLSSHRGHSIPLLHLSPRFVNSYICDEMQAVLKI